jgi:ATP-binding cassette subfamily C protein CydD
MADSDPTSAADKAWINAQLRLGRRAVQPAIILGSIGTALALAQGFCAAVGLANALSDAASSLWPVLGFILLIAPRALVTYAADRLATKAGAQRRRGLRSDAMTRLMAAPGRYFSAHHSADHVTTLVDRIEALDGLFARWLPAASLAMIGPAMVALVLLVVDPYSALIVAACGLLVPLGMAASGLGAARAARGQFLALGRLQARFLDRVRGLPTIVAHNRQDAEAAALGVAAHDLRRRTMVVLRRAFVSSAVLDLAVAVALVGLAARHGGAILAGEADAWVGLFALIAAVEFFAPPRAFALAYQDRLHATGSAAALAAIPPIVEPTLQSAARTTPPRPIRTVPTSGVSIVFDNVTLTWDPARGPALRYLSFRAHAGETVILAGPSGAGKSSVLELLLGTTRPDSGRITINGADIADLVPSARARLIAWIGQRPVLFAGTIRDNIRFARPEAAETEILEAARAARVLSFTDTLPAGLDTVIGDGGHGLSGGQAQRVAIARALLKNAPLLLLDEPTAHLDPATEGEVLDGLRRLIAGRTVILASHAAQAHIFGGTRIDLRDGAAIGARGAA